MTFQQHGNKYENRKKKQKPAMEEKPEWVLLIETTNDNYSYE